MLFLICYLLFYDYLILLLLNYIQRDYGRSVLSRVITISCVALRLKTHSTYPTLKVADTIYFSHMVYSFSQTCNGSCLITVSCMPLVILHLMGVCSVEVSHTTEYVDSAISPIYPICLSWQTLKICLMNTHIWKYIGPMYSQYGQDWADLYYLSGMI